MNKLMITVVAGALAVTLAACGGSGGSGATAKTSGSSSNAASVLQDTSGMALYTPNGESATNVRCTGACEAVWKPLRPGAASISGSSVITRPDGTKQLAVAGKPLYTFVQDSPGSVKGNGASDSFAGMRFTWHAVGSGGSTAAKPSSSGGSSGGGGYGASGGY